VNLNDFANIIAKNQEGKRKVDVTQIRDILEDINRFLGGILYIVIRGYEKNEEQKKQV
jgi:hypothetical protein